MLLLWFLNPPNGLIYYPLQALLFIGVGFLVKYSKAHDEAIKVVRDQRLRDSVRKE